PRSHRRRRPPRHVARDARVKPSERARALRRRFFKGLFGGLRVVWPILSGLLLLAVGLGVLVGRIEGWSLQESAYFALVTALTIGYGDFAPRKFITRALSIVIGMCGILMVALVAAVSVEALAEAR